MSRSREYEEERVLRGAMQAFREKGFSGTSVRDLETFTGISSGSIYNAFVDKQGLFDAAIAHYNRVVVQGRLDRYALAGSGLAGLRELFRSLLHEPGGSAFGCLLTNSAVESGTATPLVAEGLELLRGAFLDRLTEADADGCLAAGRAPEVTSVEMLVLYQGFAVLVRAGLDAAALESVIDNYFDSLETRHDH